MASISTLRKPDGTIKGFQTNLGKDPTTGKAQRKFHKTYDEAQAYIKSEESGKLGTGELYRKRAEIIFCLQRLTKAGATINEATEFFLRHGAKMGNPAFEDVVSNFIKDKRQAERRKNYLDDLAVKFEVFGRYIGPETKIGDITEEQIKEYIFVKNESNSKVTKLNNIRCLSVIFNYAIKKKFISLNPVAGIERPTVDFEAPTVIAPEDFAILLGRCLKKKWYDRLTVFVLVGFCGIRTEEAVKLTWADIKMKNAKVSVTGKIAKKGKHRSNDIPRNAMKWLRVAYDARRTGPIIGDNWKNLLRSAIRFSHINYTKNCLRHSFCSYALESGRSLENVIADMGHHGSPTMIHEHYRNIVEEKDALKWWRIVPKVGR